MKIAVTYENGEVFQHFGHTVYFKIYIVEDGKIVNAQVISTNGQGHGALAAFLFSLHVDVLICGGIGPGARNAIESMGIQLYGGVSGPADDCVNALLSNSLQWNPEACCNHHEHKTCSGNNSEAHSCSSDICHSDEK